MKRQRWSDEIATKFLTSLASTGNVTASAMAIGFGRSQMYDRRKADAAFAALWDEAEAMACDALEAEARRRSIAGVLEPVFHKGMKCGTIRRYSDTLLIAQLKAHRPEKYRERYEHTGKDGAPLVPELSDSELARRIAFALTKSAPTE